MRQHFGHFIGEMGTPHQRPRLYLFLIVLFLIVFECSFAVLIDLPFLFASLFVSLAVGYVFCCFLQVLFSWKRSIAQ